MSPYNYEMIAQGTSYNVCAKVWLHPGESGAWHFVHVDKKQSAEIREKFGTRRRGFGSIPVEVTIGSTKWRTSIFPDSRSGTYLLPLKASVRRAEEIAVDDDIKFAIRIVQ